MGADDADLNIGPDSMQGFAGPNAVAITPPKHIPPHSRRRSHAGSSPGLGPVGSIADGEIAAGDESFMEDHDEAADEVPPSVAVPGKPSQNDLDHQVDVQGDPSHVNVGGYGMAPMTDGEIGSSSSSSSSGVGLGGFMYSQQSDVRASGT